MVEWGFERTNVGLLLTINVERGLCGKFGRWNWGVTGYLKVGIVAFVGSVVGEYIELGNFYVIG